MKIAVASGKGGTGKTTVAVALAGAAPGPVQYLDCDVEEPNGHLFLRPVIEAGRDVTLAVPRALPDRCNHCGKCRDICRFNAITVFGKETMVFPELCHCCGGCFLVCPEQALVEEQRLLGRLEQGRSGEIAFVHGRLRVGEAMAVPLIHEVLAQAGRELVIIDAPPGTSCPFVAAVRGSDYVLLVSEPTPFGLHDLQLAVAVLRRLALPFGVIINRADLGDGRSEAWCEREQIPIHLRIPFDRKIAAGCGAGETLIESRPELRAAFAALPGEIQP
ncbi:MAG: ATP-binding protein [Desulfobulbaceae bacterium]